ncbi:MAG: hypothetical protein ATN36_01730 [Epulopiscium sp. Nele67-Bin005]|nr:MAG: hypothetical protein ATN36_01730 [Epulopiscium sp. Nele67-Bin005]
MIIVTTDHIPSKEIKDIVGYVQGGTICKKNLGKDSSISFMMGGELNLFAEMLVEAKHVALNHMANDAKRGGANAIIGLRVIQTPVMQGAIEIFVYGTGVVI